MRDKTLMMTMLSDFYGELLTEKQRSCFNMHWFEDLSLGEIAEVMGISRQGVRDLIVRGEATLTDTEAKVGLIRRFEQQRKVLDSMESELSELAQLCSGRAGEIVRSLSAELEGIRN